MRAENTQLPQLSSVGGYLSVEAENTQLPQLSSVGGYLYVEAGIKFKKGKIKFNHKKTAQITKKLALEFNFNCFLKMGFLFADRILAKIISKRKSAGNTVYKVQLCGKTDISYCIEVNGIYSHGKTLKEAKDSLIYKISNRDTSIYKDYSLDTVVTFEEGIKMYRVITGACEAGTRNFVEHLTKKKKKYTVQEIITATKGQFGNETFKEFFNDTRDE